VHQGKAASPGLGRPSAAALQIEIQKGLLLIWSAVAESEASLRVQDGDTAFALCWAAGLEKKGATSHHQLC